jgi:hypothetical protein
MFRKAADFEAFERVMVEAHQRADSGDDEWVSQTVKALNLEHTVRRERRPRKANRSVTDSEG